ncbi:MAG: DNA internalization-related competence protein ComEC/Rec2 [Myxococcales bacterium]
MGRPLLAACAVFAAAAYLGLGRDFGLALALACCAAAAGTLGALRWRPAAALGLCAALGLVRGGSAGKPGRDGALDAALVDPTLDRGGREAVRIEGTVLEAEPRPRGLSVVLRIERLEPSPGDALREPADPPFALILVEGAPAVGRGARIGLFARLRDPPRALNPGERDRRRDLALRGIAYQGSAGSAEVLTPAPRFWQTVAELRARFARRCAQVCTTPARAGLVAALGAGDRSLIPPEVEEDLAASGLVHLLASSGLHLAIVALLVRWVAKRLWLRGPWAGRGRAAAVASLCAAPAVAAEVLLLGAPWPAVRAGIGAGLALSADLCGRRADGLTALLAAAATCALVDPAATHDLALQLSVAGVAGMLVLAEPLRDFLPRPLPPVPGPDRLSRMAGRVAEHAIRLACATAAATLFTGPLIAAAFHRVSLASVAANTIGLAPGLLAIPIASLAVPIDGLFAPAALPLFWAADHLAGLTLLAARGFAALPYARIVVAAPAPWTALLWWAAALLLAGWPAPLAAGSRPRRPPARTRIRRALFPACALLCTGFVHAASPSLSNSLRITFLAVGQGDSTIVQLPGGRAVLVDGGGDLRGLAPPGADVGSRTVLPALAELGVLRLDAVVLTHPHPDHAGGLFAVLDQMRVGELWVTGEPGPGRLGDLLRERARARGVPVREPERGALEMGGVRIDVLQSGWDPSRSTNDNSLVLRLVHGEVAVLLAGDVEALAEAELAQSGRDVRADVLKAGHHGSRTSSTDAFLRAVRPSHVVFSVGAHNPFGFPHGEVVDRVRSFAGATWRTDRGAVTAISDGHRVLLEQAAAE